ncbi:hypothetical protein TIFTF001_016513 [Ficus carica]|uniref:Uncharacterized protein n=1 Tax=Ficus carica TaxID=3494 RepID=A0AA88ATE4_FICCA|nr:hypothetical protein TIFTF001_016513 [Ficus carica]
MSSIRRENLGPKIMLSS